MSAHRYQATWRSITFNRYYLNTGVIGDFGNPVDGVDVDPLYANSDYRLDALDLAHVTALDFREIKQHLEGAEANEIFEGIRVITGQGRILGASPADLEEKTWALFEAFSPAACREAFKNNDPPGVGPFIFRRDSPTGAKVLCFWCRPGIGRPVVVGRAREGLVRSYQFQLVAMDPFAYSNTLTQTTLTPGGSTNVTNNGNVYTMPKFRLTWSGAGASSVTISNTTTGKSFSFNASSATAGQVWIFDTKRALMYLESNGTNLYGNRLSGFLVDLYLQPGVNNISVSPATGLSNAQCEFRDAYA